MGQHESTDTESGISRRVFCIGMNKTGTSTIKHCFRVLQLTPIASPTTYSPEVLKSIHHFYDRKNYGDMLKLAERYKSFEDRPWNMWSMYRHLHERFPDSLFILTVRDAESWWRSTERWITITKPEVLSRYQLHLRVQQPSKESMTESYHRYNAEVEAYFAGTGQLLTMNIENGDGWAPLCNFLQVPEPQVPFPHANRQTYTPEDAEAIKTSRLLKHGLECQACHHMTIVKKGGPVKSGLRRHIQGLLPDRPFAKKLGRITTEQIMNKPVVRSVFYGYHSQLKAAKQWLLAKWQPKQKPVYTADTTGELAVVACLFNPSGSRSRINNFNAFLKGIKASGVRVLVVELAFYSNPFQILDHDDVIQLRTNGVMWHKERLINIGIRRLLSEGVTKIAWLDGDIVFADPNWPQEVSARLEHSKLCPVFDTVSVCTRDNGSPMLAPSAIKYYQNTGKFFVQSPINFVNLAKGMLGGGQSGFGWAARAEVLEKVLLYENAIVGGGDKLMLAASLATDFQHSDFQSLTCSKISCEACGHKNRSADFSANYQDWARRWSAAVGGEVDYARLYISDMYHGERSDRGYTTRHDILYRHDFNPAKDLKAEDNGCHEWNGDKASLQHEIEAYFLSRREDI